MNCLIRCLLFFTFFFWCAVASAQEPLESFSAEDTSAEEILIIGTVEREPFSFLEGETLTGFSIELFDVIAKRSGWTHEYKIFETFPEMLNAVKAGTVDAAVANISITADREEVMDFSASIYDGGMLILLSDRGEIMNIVYALFSPAIFGIILFLFAILCIGALLLKMTSLTKKPLSYVESLWKVITLHVHNKDFGDVWIARLVIAAWFTSCLLALIVATVHITVRVIDFERNEYVEEVRDLRGLNVGVMSGSTAEVYLRTEAIGSIAYSNIFVLFEDVENGTLDAIVHDAPVIDYYVNNRSAGHVRVVGDVFNQESYGIALPEGSPLRESIDQAILRMWEIGIYEILYHDWFRE